MKKTVSLILALVLMCTTLFSLTACGGSTQDTDKAVAEATAPLKAQIETLEKTIFHAEARIADREAENKTLTDEKNSLSEENTTLKANVSELEAEITELEAKVARLKSALDGDTATLNAEIERLEAEVKTLKAEKETLTAKVTEHESKIAELEATIAAKNNEIEIFNFTVASLTAEKNALTARIAELGAENDALDIENKELEALVEALRNCLKDIHTFSKGVCTTCGKEGAYIRDGDYIYLGEYPQTIKADDVTITDTTDDRNYYLGSDGSYYAKVTAAPSESYYTFSTGTTVTSGTVYYFKVEPIRWRILCEENGEALILCDSIIANAAYQSDYTYDGDPYTLMAYTTANGAPEGTYANNYKYSNVRAWLNDSFYETAFSELARSIILTTEVDNSAKSTNPYGNETYLNNGVNIYACENTNDKVFLLSIEEASNSAYGFASTYEAYNTARSMVTSDYSRASGAHMVTSSDYYGNGWWWMRSPNYHNSVSACETSDGGAASLSSLVRFTNRGVVPALRITL